MKYRHAYHAGNYADVFKHALLVGLLRGLQRKPKGFLCLDTHAGRGAYDLWAPPLPGPPARAPEWPEGIGRLWRTGDIGAPLLSEFLSLVRRFNRQAGGARARLRFYPGSPWIAALLRRPQDRLALWECQPAEADALRREFAGRRRVAVEAGDGYAALRALLPPPERRALVFIDPPFEQPDEFEKLQVALAEGLRRLPGGVYATWYPVTARSQAQTFHAYVQALAPAPALYAELAVTADPTIRMKGCGLLVINPPWRFADELTPLLNALVETLGRDRGAQAHWAWLVPEL